MEDKVFVDTNLWIYLHSEHSIGEKSKKAVSLIDEYFESIVISTQVLGEIFSVLIQKGIKKKEEAKEIIYNLLEHFKVVNISEQTLRSGIELCLRYNFSYWDSQIIASALESGCNILFTEDMQHGQVIGTVKVVNPFK